MSMLKRHFTVTCYLIEENRVLLLHHPKHKKWLPPGGHLLENELPTEGVMREVVEETGLQIELLSDDQIWIEEWNAKSILRPYLCLVEKIPSFADQDAHEHIDLIYIGRPIGGVLLEDPLLRWFTLQEVFALQRDREIFFETQKTIEHLLHRAKNFSMVDHLQTSTSWTGA